ncbi:MAG: P-type conjugative transfer protein TrbJ [Alphaproteobacteria bacterium 65-7]|nr:MAG: P-type conjugative transfer protein TrbJ [Alphaproteobacteria bacterium 65-7]
MKRLRSLIFALSLSVATFSPAAAQWTVFDPQNYAQNVLEAARALEQINNQIQSLQNEASMLRNMAANLNPLKSIPQMSGMASTLGQISALINQAQGISFNVNATMAAWAKSHPSSYAAGTSAATLQANAQQRWQNSMSAFQDTLKIQSQVAQNIEADTSALTALSDASQNASGNLEVTQATNQLLALSTKQQLQIQSLMAAQYRAAALDRARNAQAEQEGQVQFQTFLGSSNAYTPQ